MDDTEKALIYNSRNSICLLDSVNDAMLLIIYNSRNSICLLDRRILGIYQPIYNSRNSICLLDDLASKKLKQSTIVEIQFVY